MAQLVGKACAEGTLEWYKTALSHTVTFLQWKFKTDDIDILDLNYEFATEYEFWRKSQRGCSHDTSVKYISNLKKIINICLKKRMASQRPFHQV